MFSSISISLLIFWYDYYINHKFIEDLIDNGNKFTIKYSCFEEFKFNILVNISTNN